MKAETKGKQINQSDLLDYLPQEVSDAVDNIGYELLARNGYDVTDAKESQKVQNRLSKELRKRGQSLEYSLKPSSSGFSVLWFVLKEGDNIVDKSVGIKFVSHTSPKEEQ